LTFDLSTLKLVVASKMGNLHSEFEYARPLGSRVVRYVRDGRTDDGRTKATHTAPSLPVGHNNQETSQTIKLLKYYFKQLKSP